MTSPASRRRPATHFSQRVPPDAYIYYGKNGDEAFLHVKIDPEAEKKLKTVELVTEDHLNGEDKEWAKFSYGLARSAGQNLFKAAGGSFGFSGAEPILVLLTDRSVIVIMNFKYATMDRSDGTGQLMAGYEFSRNLKEYKTFYEIYDTFGFNPSTTETFKASLPYVTQAIQLYLGTGP